MPLAAIADHLARRKASLIEGWRAMARADPEHASRRLALSDAQLDDHLPSLFDALVESLRDNATPRVEHEGSEHGHQRRSLGYHVSELLWELTLFRRVLMDAVETCAADTDLPEARTRILDVLDRSREASVRRYIEAAEAERDALQARLRRENEQKDRFLAMLAHELRNPMGPILNSVRLLGHIGLGDPRIERARQIIERQARNQARLIDDLLDVSRLSRGTIVLKRELTDFRDAVQQAIDTCLPAIEKKQHRFDVEGLDRPANVVGDPARLAQIATNVLSNAAKFTPALGGITLTLGIGEGEVTLRVRDTGAGIAPDLLPHVFDMFVQADTSLDRTTGGLGVGLTLAKQLVEAQGGHIEARSAGLGQGTELTVRLPAAPPALGSAAIAVVEDNEDARESLSDLLGVMGVPVMVARDGEEALRLAAEHKPVAYVVDVGLPGMSGFEVARRLREMTRARPPLLIALTGYGTPEDRRRALEAGFDHHMTKPADLEELLRLLAARVGPKPGA